MRARTLITRVNDSKQQPCLFEVGLLFLGIRSSKTPQNDSKTFFLSTFFFCLLHMSKIIRTFAGKNRRKQKKIFVELIRNKNIHWYAFYDKCEGGYVVNRITNKWNILLPML